MSSARAWLALLLGTGFLSTFPFILAQGSRSRGAAILFGAGAHCSCIPGLCEEPPLTEQAVAAGLRLWAAGASLLGSSLGLAVSLKGDVSDAAIVKALFPNNPYHWYSFKPQPGDTAARLEPSVDLRCAEHL